jgi:hypothetical protein
LSLAALILVAAAACGQQNSNEAASTVTVTESGATQTQPSAPSSSASATAQAGTFQATLLPVQETHGTTSINVKLPQVTGEPAAVRDRFNNGMRTALDQFVTPDSDTTVDDGGLAQDEKSRVTTNTPHVLAGVAIFNWYTKGAAHPNNSVATIAINVDSAQPILLTDVFSDQQAAADRLSTAVTQINPDVAPVDPRTDNFLNWVPLPEGFHVYVPVSHVMGDYFPVTVPWDRISDLMTPAMRTALIP